VTEQLRDPPAPTRPPRWRWLVKNPIRRGSLLILLALVIEYLVLPQIAGVGRSLHLLQRVNLGFVALGVLLEVASLASYAELTRAVLPKGSSHFSRIWRIDLSTLAVSHVLPGGTAGGDGLGFRLLTNEGVSRSDAGLALAVQGIGSALVLNAILWVALVVSVPVSGFNPIYATAAIIGALLLGAFAGLLLLLTKGEERAAVALSRLVARLPFLKDNTADAADRLVHQIAARIRVMAVGSRELAARRGLALRLSHRIRSRRESGRPARRLRPRLRARGHPGDSGGLGRRRSGARAEPCGFRRHPRDRHSRGNRLPGGQLLATHSGGGGGVPLAGSGRYPGGGRPERRDLMHVSRPPPTAASITPIQGTAVNGPRLHRHRRPGRSSVECGGPTRISGRQRGSAPRAGLGHGLATLPRSARRVRLSRCVRAGRAPRGSRRNGRW